MAPTTAARVLDAAERLGHPVTTVAGDAGGHVVLLVSDAESPICVELAPELAAAARRSGWSSSVMEAHDEPSRAAALRVAIDLGAGAVVVGEGVLTTVADSASALSAFAAAGGRVVVLGEPVAGYDAVAIDDGGAGATLVAQAARPWWRRAVVLAGPGRDRALDRRAAAIAQALTASEIEVVVVRSAASRTAGTGSLRAALDGGARVDAVLAVTDHLALGAYKEIHGRGLRIPDDVAVGGVDGVAVGREVTPSLTTVEIPYRAAADHAWQLASTAPGEEPDVVRLASSFRTGGSTSAP